MNKMGHKKFQKLVTPFFAFTGFLVLLSAGTFWKDRLVSIQDELPFCKRVSFQSPAHYSVQSVNVGEGFKPFDSSECDNIFLDIGSNVGVQIRNTEDFLNQKNTDLLPLLKFLTSCSLVIKLQIRKVVE